MKKSELIKRLEREVADLGDEYIKSVKIEEMGCTWSFHMTSRTRKNNATGHRANMNLAEFRKYCEENPIKGNGFVD